MSLSNPRVEYVTIRDAIISLLNNNSSTLNNGLSSNVKQIKAGNPFTIPIPATMYPSIFIRLDGKDEEFVTIGGGRKRVTLHFSIFGIVRIIKSSSDSDDEAIKLADNIEAVFRDNININSNVNYCNPVSTDFGIGETEGGVYVSMIEIRLDCVKELK